MSLEHLVVPESKVEFKKKKKSVDEGYVQRAQEPNKKASNSQMVQPWRFSKEKTKTTTTKILSPVKI